MGKKTKTKGKIEMGFSDDRKKIHIFVDDAFLEFIRHWKYGPRFKFKNENGSWGVEIREAEEGDPAATLYADADGWNFWTVPLPHGLEVHTKEAEGIH